MRSIDREGFPFFVFLAPTPALLYNKENSEKAVFPFAFSASF